MTRRHDAHSRTGTPLRENERLRARVFVCRKIQFEMRWDSERKRIMDMDKFRFVFLSLFFFELKIWIERIMKTNFEWPQAHNGHSGTWNQSQINWFQKLKMYLRCNWFSSGALYVWWCMHGVAGRDRASGACTRTFVKRFAACVCEVEKVREEERKSVCARERERKRDQSS